jgi:hypothetical protein
MNEKTELSYQGSKFPWWLALIWIGFLTWFVGYLLYYGLPNFIIWLKQNPIDKFVQ